VLQHIRDEAHRFAITYHRQRRDRRALSSPLDEIRGVGPSRKRALMKRFGSLTKIRQAEPGELAATPGVGPRLADEIHQHLHAVAASDRRESA
jgi:excinuclease ABC subunit C